jgi:hypothetical protein
MTAAVELDLPHLNGAADAQLEEIVARLDGFLAADPDLSFQAVAFHHGRPVLDVWGGPHLGRDSLMVPFSVTKNIIGVSIGLLVERGELDLDAPVVEHWPEFGRHGKSRVTVRQLLSHQAGVPQATPSLTWAELLDHHAGAERLADSPPFWEPGSAFGCHALTIGNLGSELVFRVTGRTLHDFYEQEIRAPHGIDFHLGLPAGEEDRRVPTLPMIRPVSDSSTTYSSLLMPIVWETPGPAIDLANDEVSWRFGHPGASGTGSARGIASLLAMPSRVWTAPRRCSPRRPCARSAASRCVAGTRCWGSPTARTRSCSRSRRPRSRSAVRGRSGTTAHRARSAASTPTRVWRWRGPSPAVPGRAAPILGPSRSPRTSAVCSGADAFPLERTS